MELLYYVGLMVDTMWNGRALKRSVPPRTFYHSYALLVICLALSTNNGLQCINSPFYNDGHASSTEKFLVAEFDGLLRVRVHDTLKRSQTKTSFTGQPNAARSEENLISQPTKREVFLVGDSILRSLQGRKMSSTG